MKRGLFILIMFLFITLAGAVEEYKDFQVDQNILRVLNIVGEGNIKELKIRNTGTADLDFFVDLGELHGFIETEKSFRINIAKEKDLLLNFVSNHAGVFTDEIVINADSISRAVPTILEVESKNPIFDVSVDIPAKFREVASKQEVVAQITIFNIRTTEAADVSINYLIKDMHDHIIFEDSEVINVKDENSYLKEFKLPSYLKEGNYVLVTEVEYDGLSGVGTSLFRIVEDKKSQISSDSSLIPYFVCGIVFVIFLVLFLFWYLRRDVFYLSRFITPKDEITVEKERLRKRILLLERSFKLNYIPGKEYNQRLNKLKARLKELDKLKIKKAKENI